MPLALNRKQQSRIYTPRGHKPISTGLAFVPGTAGTYPTGTVVTLAAGAVDLSTPVLGIRLVVKGRITVGTAAFTTVNPQPIQNLLSNIDIFGQHKILGSDTHPFSMDGAMWYDILHQHIRRAAKVYISKAGGALTLDGEPSTPYPTSGFDGSVNTFDFIFDLPIFFHPFQVAKGAIAGFKFRSEEWGDSLQIKVVPGGQAGNASGSLGAAAATTTVAFSAFQSATGNPTIDVYSLPLIMGATTGLPATVVPGVLVRTTTPRTTQVQAAGNVLQVMQLQKRKTSRLYLKAGVGTNLPVFTSLSDTLFSTMGIQVGTDKFPRNNLDWFVGTPTPEDYDGIPPVQGFRLFDFLNSQSPFSTYEGDNVTEGATFYFVANIPSAVGNAGLLGVQEQILREPEGELYNF